MDTTIQSIIDWFKAAKPEPSAADIQVQIGCHLEEVLEMIEELQTYESSSLSRIHGLKTALKNVSNDIKAGKITFRIKDEVKFLDSLGDQIVTAIGVSTYKGYDTIGALQEIAHSNWTKFDLSKPVFDIEGKIIKGPYYKAPELEHYIGGSYAGQEGMVGSSPEDSSRQVNQG